MNFLHDSLQGIHVYIVHAYHCIYACNLSWNYGSMHGIMYLLLEGYIALEEEKIRFVKGLVFIIIFSITPLTFGIRFNPTY